MPGLSFLRKYGTVAASHDNARKALQAGAAVLVYPGGDYEVHRPSWERHRVDFGGRKGFIRLALDEDVPIVPVVSVGGQETALFLSRGECSRALLGLDRLFRLKVLPISLALPWGINVGDMLGHMPLPAKITVEALPPIDLREEFGDEPDVDEVYDHVDAPDAGHARRARRRAAPAGDRMRVADGSRSARRRRSSGSTSPTRRATCTSCPASPAGRSQGEQRTGLGARYRMLLRVGSAEVGGLIEVVECAEARDLAWMSVTGVDQRGRWRLRERADPAARRVELRLAYGVAGAGLFGWLAEQVAAPIVRGHLRRSLQQLKRQVEHEQLRARPPPAAGARRLAAASRRAAACVACSGELRH